MGICNSCKARIKYIEQPRCMRCGKPLANSEQEYCRDCGKKNFAYDQGQSLWLHQKEVARGIYQFKFHNKRIYAKIFAGEWTTRYDTQLRRWQVQEIIPIPLHPSKRRQRGYNQAGLLAEELGRQTGLLVNQKAVFRIRKTRPQKELDGFERVQNLKDAFGVSKSWKPKKSVLLVDDIYTTGNTINRVAKLLKKAGAEKVYFLTISIGQGL